MKILFLHGWHSLPGGVKPTYLKDHGIEVINPKLDDDDFQAALEHARDEFDKHRPEVVVGSSRGGALAMNLDRSESKLVLLCPAWKKWGLATKVRSDTIILHSRADDVIPYEDSVELARTSNATLIECGHDHRLADDESLAVMLWACQLSASGEKLPWTEDDPESSSKNKPIGDDATYICDSCGEEIVIPLDLTEGVHQRYVEDCPVCCNANVIFVDVDDRGNVSVHAQPEQDRDEHS
ncbi:MAG: CPXCG motif-containing cysteine-rich protein [Planctomycetota bacterium]|jgi:predicted esterase YcpF (UPF0227 family)